MSEMNPPVDGKPKKTHWLLWGALAALVVLLLAVGGVLWKNQSVHENALMPFWEPTITLTPTNTWTPSATYTPSITPTATITPTPTPPVIGMDFTPNMIELERMEGIHTIWDGPHDYLDFRGFSFSPNGDYVAVATNDGVQIFDLRDGRIIQKWDISAHNPVFSPDGNYLILNYHAPLGSFTRFENKIWVLRISDGELAYELDASLFTDNPYYNYFVSDDGRYLAMFENSQFHIVDLQTREIIFEANSNYGIPFHVVFSPDDSLVAVGGSAGIIRIYQPGNTSTAIAAVNIQAPHIRDLAFSPDGSMMAAISSSGKAFVWRTSDWELLTSDIPVYASLVNIGFASNGLLYLTSLEENEIVFIDTGEWEKIYSFKQNYLIGDLVFYADGHKVAVTTGDGALRVWDLDYEPYDGSDDWEMTESLIREFPGGHTEMVVSVAFSPDGSLLASAAMDWTVKLWRTSDWVNQFTLLGHTDMVEAVAFSPDGNLLASGSDDHTVRIWDTHTGKELKVLEGHGRAVYSLAFSPDGTLLASGSSDRTVRIWRVSDWSALAAEKTPDESQAAPLPLNQTGRIWQVGKWSLVTVLDDYDDWVWSVVFSPDGTLLASGSSDSWVRIWRVSDWERVAKFGEGGSYVGAVAFSPDQTMVARAGWDGTIRLYDLETTHLVRTLISPGEENAQGEEVNPLLVHTNRIWSITFSRDGALMIAASLDGKVRIWRVSDGTLLQEVDSGEDVLSVSLSPNGWWLAAASGVDVIVYGLPVDAMLPKPEETGVPQPTNTPSLSPTP